MFSSSKTKRAIDKEKGFPTDVGHMMQGTGTKMSYTYDMTCCIRVNESTDLLDIIAKYVPQHKHTFMFLYHIIIHSELM